MSKLTGWLKMSALAAAMAAAGPGAAADMPPNVPMSPSVKADVDLAYLLSSGMGTPSHLPQFIGSTGVFSTKDVPSPLAAQRGALVNVRGKAFDQLYYVGNSVSSWILKTSAGLIMFDAMNNSEDSEKLIEPGMRAMGLDPAQLKYIVIMHAHGDHFGGVKYFQDKYHPKVLAGPRDWDTMDEIARQPKPRAMPPKRDVSVQDGQKLTLGDTTVTLYLTPGHTMDTVSALIPVTHKGKRHLLSFWGGTGAPRTLEPGPGNMGYTSYQTQLVRFARLSLDAGADGVISNHSVVDETPARIARMAKLKPTEENPWIMGKDGFARWIGGFITAVDAGATWKRENPAANAALGGPPPPAR